MYLTFKTLNTYLCKLLPYHRESIRSVHIKPVYPGRVSLYSPI